MVVICKNWQALPVSATTITLGPGIEVHTQPHLPAPSPSDITQRPTAHLSSEPDLVELPEITHDETKEPRGGNNEYCNTPPLIRPKKKSRIIQQQGLLDQFSFSSS